jgi:hypothetical protein
MPRYADTLLADGEQVVLRTRQHFLATVIDGRGAWLLFLGSLVLLFLSRNIGEGTVRDVIGWVTLGAMLIGLAWLAKIYWSWFSQDYLITNRRVVKVEGIINKRAADSSLEKINDAVLTQDLVGRIFNYGDLDILTAADVAVDQYRMLNRAPLFKREMLNQKHDLEGEFSRPMPAPPLRAGAPGVPMPPPGAGVAAEPVVKPREMSADEVTRALSGLADLRDRGAISVEEYEAKKAQLLARL